MFICKIRRYICKMILFVEFEFFLKSISFIFLALMLLLYLLDNQRAMMQKLAL